MNEVGGGIYSFRGRTRRLGVEVLARFTTHSSGADSSQALFLGLRWDDYWDANW